MADEWVVVRQTDDYDDGPSFLVQRGTEHVVIMSYIAPDTNRRETLAFQADADGAVTCWLDIAGGIGWTLEDTLDELNGRRRARSYEERAEETILAIMEVRLDDDVDVG